MNLQESLISSTLLLHFKSSIRSGELIITSVDPVSKPMVTGIIAHNSALYNDCC